MAAKKKSSSKIKSAENAKSRRSVTTVAKHHVEISAAPVAVAEQVEQVAPARDRSSVIDLIAKLRNWDAEIARDAATMLAHLPADAEAIGALSAAVTNQDGYFHPVVRASAAASLGRLGDRQAVDALLVGINDTMAEASEEAIKALGIIGDARAIPALEAVVQNDRGFFLDNVRRTAQDAIEKISHR
jgi:HEAT repeat protein